MARDAARAYAYYLRAAEQGHERAMNLAGRCCEEGWGTVRDAHAAAAWYRRSAQAGYFRGQYNWASTLLGQGRAAEAAEWFERAAAGGPAAMRQAVMETLDRVTRAWTGSSAGTGSGAGSGRSAGIGSGAHEALRDLTARLRAQPVG